MQEEVEKGVIRLVLKIPEAVVQEMIRSLNSYLGRSIHSDFQKITHPAPKHGQMTVKQLLKHHEQLENIPISDKALKEFKHIAREYGADFAIVKEKDPGGGKPTYNVFFKARDLSAIDMILKEYQKRQLRRQNRPSLKERLEQNKKKVKEIKSKVRKKERIR